MPIVRPPRAGLGPFLKAVWFSETEPAAPREHVLPTGDVHLAFRIKGPAVRLYRDSADKNGCSIGFASTGGPRTSFYVKDTALSSASVGAVLRPGAARSLFGVPASDLAGRHVTLADLWGAGAAPALQRIQSMATPEDQLVQLEDLLAARLPHEPVLHPAVESALEGFRRLRSVRDVVASTGFSHRHFVSVFRDAVGLTPKAYCRVQRFQRALTILAARPSESFADLAAACGYSDQAHFHREFKEIAGFTPAAYRVLAPAYPNHVPAGAAGQFSSRRATQVRLHSGECKESVYV